MGLLSLHTVVVMATLVMCIVVVMLSAHVCTVVVMVCVLWFRYRRSYDSEYTAPLVNHHIFPCLMQGIRVLVKGEACTRRGASLSSPRLSRSRSTSPVR